MLATAGTSQASAPEAHANAEIECKVPMDDFLLPKFHVQLKNGSRPIHEADTAAAFYTEETSTWHWFLGTDSGWQHLISRDLCDWEWAVPLTVTGQGGLTGSITATPHGIFSFVPGCGGAITSIATCVHSVHHSR